MSLIACPACTRPVSLAAPACPGCGHPLRQMHQQPQQHGHDSGPGIAGVAVGTIMCVGGIIACAAGHFGAGFVVGFLGFLVFVVGRLLNA